MTNMILLPLSTVRLCCLARLISICKEIISYGHITMIDMAYELTQYIVCDPRISMSNNNGLQLGVSNIHLLLDPEMTYRRPQSPSDKRKRGEIAFVMFLLCNNIPFLNEESVVNDGPPLRTLRKNLDQSSTESLDDDVAHVQSKIL